MVEMSVNLSKQGCVSVLNSKQKIVRIIIITSISIAHIFTEKCESECQSAYVLHQIVIHTEFMFYILQTFNFRALVNIRRSLETLS